MTPKINLLYYKNILDLVIIDFVNDYNDQFINVDGKYVLGKQFSKTKLKKIFKDYFVKQLKEYVKPYFILSPNYYFIIGSCMPKDNMLLKYSDGQYVPEKLKKIINSKFEIKWILKETDIKIDLVEFNSILISLFNEFFSNKYNVIKELGKNYSNIFFVSHKDLCCYSLFKILKHKFGSNNCVNLFVEKMKDKKLPLIAINDLICKYVHNKVAMNKSEQFKIAMTEVCQYVSECIKK